MASDAALCYDELLSRGCDPTLLFWLRHPVLLEQSAFGGDMLAFAKEMGVPPSCFRSHEFHAEVRRLVNSRG